MVAFLNNEEGIVFELPKHNMISMCPNIPNDNNNFFHRMLKESNNFYGLIQAKKRNYLQKREEYDNYT